MEKETVTLFFLDVIDSWCYKEKGERTIIAFQLPQYSFTACLHLFSMCSFIRQPIREETVHGPNLQPRGDHYSSTPAFLSSFLSPSLINPPSRLCAPAYPISCSNSLTGNLLRIWPIKRMKIWLNLFVAEMFHPTVGGGMSSYSAVSFVQGREKFN